MQLPARFKGCGLRILEDCRYAEYIGGMIPGIPPLLTSRTSKNLLRTGRLDMVIMREWLGEDSFRGIAAINPWVALDSHDRNSQIYNKLEHYENQQGHAQFFRGT